jgi:hypothetical protein
MRLPSRFDARISRSVEMLTISIATQSLSRSAKRQRKIYARFDELAWAQNQVAQLGPARGAAIHEKLLDESHVRE